MIFFNIKRLVNLGFYPGNIVVIWSYITISVLFPLDVIAGTEISLHILYVFPLALIALHSEHKGIVIGAVTLSVTYQVLSITLYDDLSLLPRTAVVCIVIISDSLAVYIARLLRETLLEHQATITEIGREKQLKSKC